MSPMPDVIVTAEAKAASFIGIEVAQSGAERVEGQSGIVGRKFNILNSGLRYGNFIP